MPHVRSAAERDNGSGGDVTPGIPSPTHGARVRQRKRSSDVSFYFLFFISPVEIYISFLVALCFLILWVVDNSMNFFFTGSIWREQNQWR